MYDPPGYLRRSPSPGSSRSRPRPAPCCTPARCVPGWAGAGGAARRGRGSRARRLVHRQRGDRGSRLVPHRLGPQAPWLPVAFVGFLGVLLALRRIPVVARALAAPGAGESMDLPHTVPGGRAWPS